jgi:hypothetical protein
MPDIIDILVNILKIDPQLVSQYAPQGPMYQMFYLFIFPTLFIIVFVYVLSRRVMERHTGLRILIAVAIYIFIILQGYYNWFVYLSKFWLFGLIFLGFVYLIMGRGGERPEGGAKGKVLGTRGVGFRLRRAVEDKLGFSLNPITDFAAIADVDQALREKIKERSRLEKLLQKTTSEEERKYLMDQLGRIEREIAQLEYQKKHPIRRKISE